MTSDSGFRRMLVNARIATMEPGTTLESSAADAIAWRDGRILAVGARAEVERIAGPDAERFDAGGATVLPGFIDAHHHASHSALYGGALRLTPPHVTDIESLQRALASAARDLPASEWLVATDWDELLLSERRPPTRRELDDAVPDRPLVAIHYSCHRALANSRAIEAVGIGRDTRSPSGGQISRGHDRVPDGLFIERALCPFESRARKSLVARDADGFIARLRRHHEKLVASGITHICDATVPGDIAVLYREAERRGALIVPTSMFPVSTAGYFEAPWDVLDAPRVRDEGSLLTTGPVKLVFDGAPGCAMCLTWWQAGATVVKSWMNALRDRSLDAVRAAMSVKPRVERFGSQVRTGIAIYRREEAAAIVRAASERGFAVAIHAIGNAAVDVALSAFEEAKPNPDAPRRIEHATFVDRELVSRLAGAGITVVAQPHFVTLPVFASAPAIPALPNSPLRWLLDAKVSVAGSSDYPVAGFDPLDGIRSAVARRSARGHVLDADQRLSLDEALVMYTRAAAEASGSADVRGTLTVGKRADLVVLDRSLTGPSALDLEGARVRGTVVGGALVFGAIDDAIRVRRSPSDA